MVGDAQPINGVAVKHHVCELRVRYAETDRMGVAHHSSYLLWFELARTGLLREAGHPYREMEEAGTMLPVVEYGCRLVRGAEYDDAVRIEVRVTELRSRSVRFDYRVLREDELLVTGFTRHVCVDGRNRLRRLPPEVVDDVTPYLGA